MSDENSVTLIGNLGVNPELRHSTTKGTPVCNFTLATNEVGRKTPEWHRIVVWGKTAETCAKYLRKGRKIHVKGKLQTRKWNDRDGNVRYTTEIVAQRVNFLDRGASVEERPNSSVSEYDAPEVDGLSEEAQALLGSDTAF